MVSAARGGSPALDDPNILRNAVAAVSSATVTPTVAVPWSRSRSTGYRRRSAYPARMENAGAMGSARSRSPVAASGLPIPVRPVPTAVSSPSAVLTKVSSHYSSVPGPQSKSGRL